jgi:phytoene synthase
MNASKSSSFRWGFLVLPENKQRALEAVYAWCRHLDDIVDEGLPEAEARKQLDYWNQEIFRLYEGKPEHELSKALAPFIRQFPIPKDAFYEMVRGCRMDLDKTVYDSPEKLESYMAGVASSVGDMCTAIFSPQAAGRLKEFSRFFGYAFQLTNIIRDVGEDLKLGRVYLPGVRAEQLKPGPEFTALMEKQYQRAKDYYARARRAVPPADRKALLPAEIMGHVYEGLLDDIRAKGFPVLAGKRRLPAWRKAFLAAKAWLYCHGF